MLSSPRSRAKHWQPTRKREEISNQESPIQIRTASARVGSKQASLATRIRGQLGPHGCGCAAYTSHSDRSPPTDPLLAFDPAPPRRHLLSRPPAPSTAAYSSFTVTAFPAPLCCAYGAGPPPFGRVRRLVVPGLLLAPDGGTTQSARRVAGVHAGESSLEAGDA
ncbi:unnamed protein product [Urochloa humidicola]